MVFRGIYFTSKLPLNPILTYMPRVKLGVQLACTASVANKSNSALAQPVRSNPGLIDCKLYCCVISFRHCIILIHPSIEPLNMSLFNSIQFNLGPSSVGGINCISFHCFLYRSLDSVYF
jgi:hypothetical protein